MWQELLPPKLPPPHQKPYTLLLSLDDLLVTSTWDVSGVAMFSSSLSVVLLTISRSVNMVGAQQNVPGSTISSRISRNFTRLSSLQRNPIMYDPLLLANALYLSLLKRCDRPHCRLLISWTLTISLSRTSSSASLRAAPRAAL